jgi:hypothetical protein
MPSLEFAKRLCQGSYPSIALAMFEKSAPWTRAYVRMERVKALNALGGPSGDQELVFGEQVVIVAHRGGSGAVSVSGSGDYQVLRWDGSCATLAEHELVTWVPGTPRHATLRWKYLEDGMQEALLTNDNVRQARKKHRAECRGASLGTQSPACTRAVERLNESIVIAVRTGIELPAPEIVP